ncbi:MAG: chorismate-binding protein [Bacteroidetes bacterium]|nr:chorismate-binding protein [Bacteroidota bacterium]MBS1541746.1 chorismate-binding protein [Bacteroidota bacterium]
MNSKAASVVDRKIKARDLINHYLLSGGSMMYWRKPGSDERLLLVCNSGATTHEDITLENAEPGFAIAPFDPSQKKYFFKAEQLFRFKGETLTETPDADIPELDRSKNTNDQIHSKFFVAAGEQKSVGNFSDLINGCIQQAQLQQVEKIVPSKFHETELPEGVDPLAIFNRLCEKHPMAFVSLVSSPDTGTWLGASPELLVSVDAHDQFKTVALAGTQKMQADVPPKSVSWTQKEIEEQALVSRYIINCFKKIRVREYTEHGPHTVVAGSLLHLQTEYKVDMREVNFPQMGSVMLKLLHPTSAVCGMPFQPAFDFLKKNEGYDRELYSGYWGPVNIDGESNLFVNLRCMQVLEKKVRIYAGAGITADSVAEQEAAEIEMKIKSLAQLINL